MVIPCGQWTDQWLPGVKGEGGMNRQGTEDLKGSEIMLYDTVTVDTGHHTSVQTH